MLWTKIKRIIRSGFFSFWRNGFVSLSAVLVMTVTLFVIGSTIFSGAILRGVLDEIKNKVDINVYFIQSANESDILNLKSQLEQLPEVAPPVVYESRDAVLADFKSRHQNDQFTLQALDELGTNPLDATLNIKAKDPSQYSSIVDFINNKAVGSDGSSLVDKVNYYQNKDTIDKLTGIINSSNEIGFALTMFLIIISVLITFNTLRLVIYMSREEISVMRLVGASTGYIRGPFFVAGALYGFVSAVITLIVFYPITLWLGKTAESFFVGINVFSYYVANFGEIFLIIVFSGVAIGSLSSFLAVRKYLKV
jgi:cell division transport system permease protein